MEGIKTYKYWNDNEINLIKNFYMHYEKKGLLSILQGRSWSSIIHKANKLGLTRERFRSWSKGKQLSETHKRNISKALKGKYKINIPNNILKHLYIDKKLSATKIAKLYETSAGIVLDRINEYGIKRRTRSEALKGRIISDKTKLKISKANKGRRLSPSTEFKKGHPAYAYPTKECIEKAQKANRKFFTSKNELERLYHHEKLSSSEIAKIMYVTKPTVLDWLSKYDIKTRTNSESTEISWKNKEYVLNQSIARAIQPNKPERQLIELLKREGLPFSYVGDWKVTIEGLCPDFIHKNKKQVIEIFGRAYHDPERSFLKNIPLKSQEATRKAVFSEAGYDTLILWDDKLDDEIEVVEKIRRFMNG